jgi:E3 ubiquitin-protein ligase SIAH1
MHIACSSCQGKLPGKRCHSCGDRGGGAYVRFPAMDKIVCSARVRCAHHRHGCASYVAYYEAPDHESACPRAPCSCTVPGCGFVASPPNLMGHLAAAHAWPVHNISYGAHLALRVPASEEETRALLVAAEEDGAVFVLSVCALGPARAISVVCVRANGVAGEQYGLKLWAHGSGDRAVMLSSEVTSSAAPGEFDVDAGEFLAVPPTMMTGPQAGREIVLTVCIEEAS